MRESPVQNNFLTPSQWLSQFLSSRNMESVTAKKLVVCIEGSLLKNITEYCIGYWNHDLPRNKHYFNFEGVSNQLFQIFEAWDNGFDLKTVI